MSRRVEQDELENICRVAEVMESFFVHDGALLGNNLALDLRDANTEIAALTAQLLRAHEIVNHGQQDMTKRIAAMELAVSMVGEQLKAKNAEIDSLKSRPRDGISTCSIESLKAERVRYADEDEFLKMVVLMVNQDVAEADQRAEQAEATLASKDAEIARLEHEASEARMSWNATHNLAVDWKNKYADLKAQRDSATITDERIAEAIAEGFGFTMAMLPVQSHTTDFGQNDFLMAARRVRTALDRQST